MRSSEERPSELHNPALAEALASIPAAEKLKRKSRRGNDIIVEEFDHEGDAISIEELYSRMLAVETSSYDDRYKLDGVLIIFDQLGIVRLEKISERIFIRATSESASYLLKNLARLMTIAPQRPSPVRANTNMPATGFWQVLRSFLDIKEINPHLILSNILAYDLSLVDKNPPRQTRIVSVLIKGKRLKRDSTEYVYLHTFKPAQGAYALVGSNQQTRESDEELAFLALDEDLDVSSASSNFKLMPCNVEVEPRIEMSYTRGANTLFHFNLFIATKLSGKLRLRRDLKYGWFTLDEILSQESRKGEPIITNKELIQAVHEKYDLNSERIPLITADPLDFVTDSLESHQKRAWASFRIAFSETWKAFRLLFLKLWSYRFWLLFPPLLIGLFFMLRPILNKTIPSLANIDAILGIFMFAIWLVSWIHSATRN